MQTGSSNLAQALTGGLVTWGKPLVYADWAVDGYGAASSIDDLSDQIGRPIEVTHYLDDGLPNEVTFAAGLGTPDVSIPLAGGGYVSGSYLTAAQYFSPFRSDSPVYSYNRDVAPVKIEVQTVTSAGLEAIRVFTGQMTSTPTDGQSASLKAMSGSRLKLAKLVQLPVRIATDYSAGKYFGLTAAWAITWAMHRCGIYPSPPAVSGCKVWTPGHGGGHPYLPYSNITDSGEFFSLYHYRRLAADTGFVASAPTIIEGPYVGALYGQVDATALRLWFGDCLDETHLVSGGYDWLSKAGNAGRFEFWLRGDSTAVNSTPGGSSQLASLGAQSNILAYPMMAGFAWYYSSGTSYVACGIRLTDKLPFIAINDGTTAVSGGLGTALPTDSAWHFYGFAWDINNKKLWFNVDGTVTSTNISTVSSAGLPTDNLFLEGSQMSVHSVVPVSEVQFSAGPMANHDTYPTWEYNLPTDRTATVYPSILNLAITAEPPREAWELIGRYAQAELAHFRADETDDVLYLPMTYWAKTAQQTSLATLSARRDSKPPRVTYDISKTRNSVRLTYSQVFLGVNFNQDVLWSTTSALVVPPGVTYYQIALTVAAARIFLAGSDMYVLSSAQIDGSDPSPPNLTYVSFNTQPDGSGSLPTIDVNHSATGVAARITDWTATQVLVRFTNTTSTIYYTANNAASSSVDLAFMSIAGMPVVFNEQAYVVASETASITTRGERSLPIQIDAIQTESMAQQMANILVGELAYPQATVERLEMFGDPRRQPGDLITYSDPDGTGVSGLWRMRGIKHVVDAASYTQLTTLRRARQVAVWDTGLWNDAIWGE